MKTGYRTYQDTVGKTATSTIISYDGRHLVLPLVLGAKGQIPTTAQVR
jgi:hypothetical protein